MANLEGHGSREKFEPHFNGENWSERVQFFGRVIYVSETIQNSKNPAGHIDTLKNTTVQCVCSSLAEFFNLGRAPVQLYILYDVNSH